MQDICKAVTPSFELSVGIDDPLEVLEKSNIEVGFELRMKAYTWKMGELFTHMKVNAFLFQSLCAFCRAKQRVLGKARGGRRSKRVQTGSQWAGIDGALRGSSMVQRGFRPDRDGEPRSSSRASGTLRRESAGSGK